MAAPTSYSDASLAAFMVVELGPIADVLGWVPGTPRVEYAVYSVARSLGVAAVSAATDMAGLEAVARLTIWQGAESALVTAIDITIDNESLKRSQLSDHAKAMVIRYQDQCIRLGVGDVASGGIVTIHPVARDQDPYAAAAATEF